MFIHSHVVRALCAGSLAGLATAQVPTVSNPLLGSVGFGTEGMFIGDVDSGGQRDLVIAAIDPLGFQNDGVIVISSETGAALGSLSIVPGLGRGMAFLGNIDGNPGDEFVLSSPGLLALCTGDLSLGVANVLNFIPLPVGMGDSLAAVDINGDGSS